MVFHGSVVPANIPGCDPGMLVGGESPTDAHTSCCKSSLTRRCGPCGDRVRARVSLGADGIEDIIWHGMAALTATSIVLLFQTTIDNSSAPTRFVYLLLAIRWTSSHDALFLFSFFVLLVAMTNSSSSSSLLTPVPAVFCPGGVNSHSNGILACFGL